MFRHLDMITRYLTRSGALDVLSQGRVVCIPFIGIEHDPNISSVGGCLGEVSSELVTLDNTDRYEAGGVGGQAGSAGSPGVSCRCGATVSLHSHGGGRPACGGLRTCCSDVL